MVDKAVGWRSRTACLPGRVGERLPWLLFLCGRAKAAAMLPPLGLRWEIIHDCRTWSILHMNTSPSG